MRRAVAVAAFFFSCTLASAASAQQPAKPQHGGRDAPQTPPPATVEPPQLVSDPDVDYPAGATGDVTVIVTVVVNADGTVGDVKPDDGTPEPFGSAAVSAVKGWKFDPATRGGQPIASRIKMEVAFHAPVVTQTEPEPTEAPPAETPKPVETPKPKPPRAREQTEEVRVRGAREPGRTVTLTRQEVRQIPGVFGDPFRAVEIMPGVTPIVTGLPFFFIRGAPPGNVGYYLDGVRVPLLFHVGVGPSVVHPALISRVDLYPGGYPARFGRFSGGIVAGETAPPLDRRHGEFNIRLFDAGALAETRWGPKDRGSVLLGGRYSYTGFLLTQIASDTLLNYWDYQARATYDITKDDQVGVFVFGSYDYLGQRTATADLTLFGTEFHRIDMRYDKKLSEKGSVRMAVTTGFDRSRAQEDRFVRDRVLGARSEWTYAASPRVLLRAGTDLQLDNYDVQVVSGTLAPSVARVANFFPSRSDLVMGARADTVIGLGNRFEVTPGIRTDLYTSQGATAVGVDPRIATRTEITKNVRMLAAYGIAHQAPAFVVPIPGFQPGGLKGGLQKAYQESAGLEVDLWKEITGTFTVFHNAFADMSDPLGVTAPQVSGCAPGQFPTGTIAGDRLNVGMGGGGGGAASCGRPRFVPGTIGPDRSGGGGQGADSVGATTAANAFEVRTKGEAYGLEVFLKRKLTARIGGFLSYTLSRSERTYEGRTYTATFDRTHVLNTALAFDLGRNWRAGTRVTFYSGLPKAAVPGDSSTRLPSFFRADVRLEKRWIWDKFWLSFVAEWMNATLSKESIATTCTLAGCQAQEIGPVTIPSLGLEGGF